MEKKTFKHHQSRCDYVFNVINKDKFFTLTEIRKELLKLHPPVDMSLQGIKKNLHLIEINHQVIYLEVKKNAKKFTKKLFPRKYGKRFNKYYLATPKAGKLFRVLYKKVENLNNNEKYLPLIEDVIDHYKNLEVGSMFIRKKFADEKLIHSVIKENKKHKGKTRVFKKEILGTKGMMDSYLKNKKFKEVKFKIQVNEISVNDKKYFLVNDELIPISKLEKFMGLLNLDDYMKWVAYTGIAGKMNKKQAVIPALKAMKDLFVEIVKDSQIKI